MYLFKLLLFTIFVFCLPKWSFTFQLFQWHSHNSQFICTHNTNKYGMSACQEFYVEKQLKNISLSMHHVVYRLIWMRLARVVEQTRNLVFKYWIALVSLHTIASLLFPFPFHSLNIQFFHCCIIFFFFSSKFPLLLMFCVCLEVGIACWVLSIWIWVLHFLCSNETSERALVRLWLSTVCFSTYWDWLRNEATVFEVG